MSGYSYEEWAARKAARRKTKQQVFIETYGVEMPWHPLPEGFPKGRPGHCFYTCARWAFKRKTLRYVEGMALQTTCSDEKIPWHHVVWRPDLGPFARMIRHAWLLDKNGRVIDPTWDYSSRYPERLYVGIVIPTDTLRGLVDRLGFYGSFVPKYWKPPKLE